MLRIEGSQHMMQCLCFPTFQSNVVPPSLGHEGSKTLKYEGTTLLQNSQSPNPVTLIQTAVEALQFTTKQITHLLTVTHHGKQIGFRCSDCSSLLSLSSSVCNGFKRQSLKNCPLTIPSSARASDLDPVIRNTVGKFSLIADIKHPHSSVGQICCTWISNHITKLMMTNNYTIIHYTATHSTATYSTATYSSATQTEFCISWFKIYNFLNTTHYIIKE